MMLVDGVYQIFYRGGDVLGAQIYMSSPAHGFLYCVIATSLVYALILPVLLFVPKEIVAAADGEAMVRQEAAHLEGFQVVWMGFRRAGTTKDGDDALFVHGDGCPCVAAVGIGLAAAGGASNSWIIASHNASSASCVS